MYGGGRSDKYISVFSPEGKLFQVEYCYKSIRVPGITSVGVKGKDSIVVVSQKKVPSKLIKASTVTHMYKITEKIGCVATGRVSDCQFMVKQARGTASNFLFEYGYDISVSYLAKKIATITQLFSQYVGYRQMGCSLMFFGFDEGEEQPSLFKVDPAGYYCGYFACSSGSKEVECGNFLEKKIKSKESKELNEKDVRELCITTLQSVCSSEFKADEIEMGIITKDHPTFRILEEKEVERILIEIAERD